MNQGIKSQITSAILGGVVALLGNFLYEDHFKPKLTYVISEEDNPGNDASRHKYTVRVRNSGIRPAEDITCRISVDAGKITQASLVVNGESKSISPDHPNAVFDRISYLNHDRLATFEIEAEGRSVGELFVLVIGKGVQAENMTPVPGKDNSNDFMSIILAGVAVITIIVLIDQNKATT